MPSPEEIDEAMVVKLVGADHDHTSDRHDRRSEERRHINQAGVLEILSQTDAKHDAAHKRIRHSLQELEQRLEDGLKLLADRQHAINTRVTEMAVTPLDVTKLVFTPKIVVSVVMMVLAIAGVFWATNGGLRSDVRDILTRMASEQRVSDSQTKLLEAQSATINRALETNSREMKDSIASVTKRQDLLTLQYNQLSDQLTKLSVQRDAR